MIPTLFSIARVGCRHHGCSAAPTDRTIPSRLLLRWGGCRVALGGHSLDDPLEVVDAGELYNDLALVPAEFNLDAGFEEVGQSLRQMAERRGHGLVRRGLARGPGRGVVADRHDLLDRADREPLGHDA